jgi:hypothetical protein
MNGSTENMAHGASEKPERREVALSLTTARKMLPLVQRIVADVVQSRQSIALLGPEQDRLDRKRHTLSWPERARRYQLQEEMAIANRVLQEAVNEAAALGVAVLDMAQGRVGFPTVVNGRPAFFSWRSGEDGIHFWHFPNEEGRQPIPSAWAKSGGGRQPAKK